MITATIVILALSLGRLLWQLPAAKAAPDSVELRIEIVAQAVAATTCALALLWGAILGLFGLP